MSSNNIINQVLSAETKPPFCPHLALSFPPKRTAIFSNRWNLSRHLWNCNDLISSISTYSMALKLRFWNYTATINCIVNCYVRFSKSCSRTSTVRWNAQHKCCVTDLTHGRLCWDCGWYCSFTVQAVSRSSIVFEDSTFAAATEACLKSSVPMLRFLAMELMLWSVPLASWYVWEVCNDVEARRVFDSMLCKIIVLIPCRVPVAINTSFFSHRQASARSSLKRNLFRVTSLLHS